MTRRDSAAEEARQIVRDLRAELTYGLAFARVIAALKPEERALLRRILSEALRARLESEARLLEEQIGWSQRTT